MQRGRWEELDIENLVEELEELGRSEKRELGSCLRVLNDAFVAMLISARSQNKKLGYLDLKLSRQNSKLFRRYGEPMPISRFRMSQKYYRRSRRDAVKKTQMPLESFQAKCLYLIEQPLDPNFNS